MQHGIQVAFRRIAFVAYILTNCVLHGEDVIDIRCLMAAGRSRRQRLNHHTNIGRQLTMRRLTARCRTSSKHVNILVHDNDIC